MCLTLLGFHARRNVILYWRVAEGGTNQIEGADLINGTKSSDAMNGALIQTQRMLLPPGATPPVGPLKN